MPTARDEQVPRRQAELPGEHAPEALAAELADLRARDRAREAEVAALAHDLRTPLTPMAAALHVLRGHAQAQGLATYIDVLQRSVDAMAHLVDDFTDLRRAAEGRLGLELTSRDAHPIIAEAVRSAASAATARRVTITAELHGVSPGVRADAARLTRALTTLLSAVAEGGGAGAVAVRCEASAEHARVIIRDERASADGERLQRLAGAADHPGASGLALMLARRVLTAHGARLTAGERLTLTVELPVDRPAAAAAAPEPASLERPLRILLVDDHEDSLTLTRMMLERRGYDVDVAASAQAALRHAGSAAFDVLVSDIGLPDESGLELLRRLRQRGPLVGIAVSGYGRDADLRRSREAGFVAHLTKPVNMQRLHEIIQGLFGKKGGA